MLRARGEARGLHRPGSSLKRKEYLSILCNIRVIRKEPKKEKKKEDEDDDDDVCKYAH